MREIDLFLWDLKEITRKIMSYSINMKRISSSSRQKKGNQKLETTRILCFPQILIRSWTMMNHLLNLILLIQQNPTQKVVQMKKKTSKFIKIYWLSNALDKMFSV
jgi:hypothetical protein